jgi:hypothetical protein
MRSGPTSSWRQPPTDAVQKPVPRSTPDTQRMDQASPSATGAKPKGAGMHLSADSGRARRSLIRIGASSPIAAHPSTSGPTNGAINLTAVIDLRTALIRRRSQRTALGRSISGPRSTSAAISMLLAAAVTATARSIVASNPGRRAARKSGSRLNVLRPCGQYQRAMRTPGLVSRA